MSESPNFKACPTKKTKMVKQTGRAEHPPEWSRHLFSKAKLLFKPDAKGWRSIPKMNHVFSTEL